MTSFDDLQSLDVSANMADLQVPWERVDTPGQKSLGARGTEVVTTGTYKQLKKTKYTDAVNWLYDKYANDNDSFSQVQLGMAAAGFMGKNPNFTPGTPDDPTRNSWNEILQIALASDKTPMEIIDEAIERNGGMDAALKKHNVSGGGRAKPDIQLTHPDDIRMTAKEVSRKVLGKGWDQRQLDAFVASYQAQEAASQGAAQGEGVTYTQPASLQAAAEAQARKQNPVAAGATDWDNAAQMIMKAFDVLGGGNG